MAYSNNIPKPTDQLNDSQLDLLNNFIAIQNLVGINHINFNVPDQGKHSQVTLPSIPNANVAAPTPTGPSELNIYTRVSANTNAPELTWQRQNAGIITEMTAARVEPPVPNMPRNGWSKTASGLLLKWGRGDSPGTGYVVNYPLNINGVVAPVFDGPPFIVLTTPFSVNSVAMAVTLNGNASFTVNTYSTVSGAAGASEFYYLAIGVAV